MTVEQRLDSIERLLGTVAASLQTVAINLEATADIARQNSAAIDRLEVQVAQTNKSLEDSVTQTNKSLEDSVTDLVATIGRFVEDGEHERVTFQAEINRIWNYLVGQQSNGAGS